MQNRLPRILANEGGILSRTMTVSTIGNASGFYGASTGDVGVAVLMAGLAGYTGGNGGWIGC
jgi:hypothetical protein